MGLHEMSARQGRKKTAEGLPALSGLFSVQIPSDQAALAIGTPAVDAANRAAGRLRSDFLTPPALA